MTYPFLLGTLVVVDAMFCGFRAAAGRNARLFLTDYYRASMIRGALFGLGTVAVFFAGAMVLRSMGWWLAVKDAAEIMVWFYGVFAVTVLLSLGLYLVGTLDCAVLASVLVLGPFTLIRPWVIMGVALLTALLVEHPPVVLWVLLAGLTMVQFERVLNIGTPPWKNA